VKRSEWVAPYRDFERGDVVRVQGLRGDFQWISAHLLDGEIESYTVFQRDTGMRSFVPERVTHKKRKKVANGQR
jgi:hypothetical protein